jgi:hypothetical protein
MQPFASALIIFRDREIRFPAHMQSIIPWKKGVFREIINAESWTDTFVLNSSLGLISGLGSTHMLVLADNRVRPRIRNVLLPYSRCSLACRAVERQSTVEIVSARIVRSSNENVYMPSAKPVKSGIGAFLL